MNDKVFVWFQWKIKRLRYDHSCGTCVWNNLVIKMLNLILIYNMVEINYGNYTETRSHDITSQTFIFLSKDQNEMESNKDSRLGAVLIIMLY